MYDTDEAAEMLRQKQFTLHQMMRNKAAEFSDPVNIKVMCGTWNVCNKTMDKTSSNELKAWLFPQNVYADIYALGFQEIVDLNAMNVVVDGTKSAEKANHWTIELSELLYKSGIPYTMLLQKHLVGILLVVFVRDNLLPQISDIRGNTVGTGLMGVMGNKGGVTIRLRFFDSTICFVCSHLRHQREEVAGRNMDVKMIMERTQLCPQTDNLYQAQNIMPKSSNNWRTEEFSNNLQIEQHDFIFWLGDLNYRISKSKSVDEVFELVESSSWRSLLLYDQLITEMKKGTIFNDFVEPPINFYPSYKYQPGTPLYEKRPEKKLRAPAWCDRILFKTKQPIEIELYDSPKVLISDHMPVHALFKITGRVVDSMKELEIYKKQLVIIDSMENDLAPKVELRDRMMDLGSLNLEDLPVHRNFVIANVGKAPIGWTFNTQSRPPLWLNIYPTSGVLLPGETCSVSVMIDLNSATASDILDRSKKNFDHIAVIEVVNGSHFFIPISGSLAFDSFDDDNVTSPSKGLLGTAIERDRVKSIRTSKLTQLT